MALSRREFLSTGSTLAAALAAPSPARWLAAGPHQPDQVERCWQSKAVRRTPSGKLAYHTDADGNRVPDFSYAGYHNGDRPIPDVPTVRTIGPVPGDNTAHIQSALDEVGSLAKDPSGFRGALLLLPGEYPVAGTLRMNRDGVVLRGSGDGPDPAANTVILGTGTTHLHPPVLIAGGADTWGPSVTNWAGEVPGTRTLITSELCAATDRTKSRWCTTRRRPPSPSHSGRASGHRGAVPDPGLPGATGSAP